MLNVSLGQGPVLRADHRHMPVALQDSWVKTLPVLGVPGARASSGSSCKAHFHPWAWV